MKGKLRPRYFFLMLFLFVLATVVIDFIRTSSYEVIPKRPSENIDSRQNQLYYELVNEGIDIDWTRLDGTLKYISTEYDWPNTIEYTMNQRARNDSMISL